MNALIPVIVALVGALLYALSSNGKLQELGRLMFAAAFFALMFSFAGRTAHLF